MSVIQNERRKPRPKSRQIAMNSEGESEAEDDISVEPMETLDDSDSDGIVPVIQNISKRTKQNSIGNAKPNFANTKQNSVNVKQTATKQDPVNVKQASVNTKQNSVNIKDNPINTKQNPLNTKQNPVNIKQTPVNAKQNSVNTKQTPVVPSIKPGPLSKKMQAKENRPPTPVNKVCISFLSRY